MRKPRRAVARDKPRREPYDRVLVVCEGSKTEPFYFAELMRHYKISTANVQILGEGTDPLTLVNRAKELRQRERRRGDKFDKVYCVFDRDEHATFDEASFVAQHSGLKLGRSWPCFEFWILLHFRYTRAPYTRTGDKSPAENCMTDLRVHWRKYAKAGRDTFETLEDRLEDAKRRAEKASNDANRTGDKNPSTEVHELVVYLQGLKEEVVPK